MTNTSAAPTNDWQTFFEHGPNYDDATLHIIHDDINAYPNTNLDDGELQGFALEFIAEIRDLRRALEHERSVVREAAVIAARLEAGLILDFDNLLDALQQAGYTQERCAEIWADSMP